MDAYFVSPGNGWDRYCQGCIDYFLSQGGDPNDVDGPYSDGGGKDDLIRHCALGENCINVISSIFGSKGVCLRNPLTPAGIEYTIDALAVYVDQGDGIPEILDLWAAILQRENTLNKKQQQILNLYIGSFSHAIHPIPEDQLTPPKSKKKRDSKGIYCKSCKDTGVVMLFNSSVECTDCIRL